MKYRSLGSFRADFRRLPGEHQKLFLQALREHFRAALEPRTRDEASPIEGSGHAVACSSTTLQADADGSNRPPR